MSKPKRIFRRGLRMSPYRFEQGRKELEASMASDATIKGKSGRQKAREALARTGDAAAVEIDGIVAAVQRQTRRQTLAALEGLPPLHGTGA